MKKKILVLPLLALLAAGCNSTSQTPKGENPAVTETQDKNNSFQNSIAGGLPFHCKDLFTDSDLQAVTGKPASAYVLTESAVSSVVESWAGYACRYDGQQNKNDSVHIFIQTDNVTYDFQAHKASWDRQGHQQFDQQHPGVLTGVGSDAIPQLFAIEALSTNKKYLIRVEISPTISITGNSAQETNFYSQEAQAAKIIDANLSKY